MRLSLWTAESISNVHRYCWLTQVLCPYFLSWKQSADNLIMKWAHYELNFKYFWYFIPQYNQIQIRHYILRPPAVHWPASVV